jgi:hypothetical protein
VTAVAKLAAVALPVVPESGDCYSKSDAAPRPASADYWEPGSSTRVTLTFSPSSKGKSFYNTMVFMTALIESNKFY